MAIKGLRIPKILLLILTLLIVGGFAVNWYMTYRLQSKLNERLSEEVLKATNGFYRCSFDKLSVGFFSGELSIQGVELKPDSVALVQWKSGDSLPEVYYNIHIGEIHFRGINLTWQKDYTNLHFSLFELKSPDIKVVQPVLSYVQKKEEYPGKDLRTLYEVVSPYIDELTVNRIKLSNANVHYVVEDSVSPVIYGLKGANFRAFNFRLNKDSYNSGKLLYCDHFEFEADQPQQLLYSDQLILETQNIRLSTIKSLMSIEGVHIAPEESFWNNRMHTPGGYIKAEIESVALKGVSFKRENAENYLHATSFDIASTDIQYYSVRGETPQKVEKDKLQITDTISDQTWSLYSILSPILHSISIDKIGIEKTKFNYTLTQKGYTDIYTLYHFDFHANNFLVDSLSEQQKKFWYVDNFTLTGDNINGLMESNNSNISANSLYLSTIDSSFQISDITVKPLSLSSSKDYMSGGIKQIGIEGLDYDKGVSASQLRIDSFNIDYYKVTQNVPKQPKSKGSEKPEDILDMFTPYADYLSVRNINLKDANITFHDKTMKETYRLQHLNFYATEFLIDEQTRRASRYLFTCNDIGLSIKDFDNLLPGGYYRLQVKDADISTLTGKLKLEDVRLVPQTATWTDVPDTYYDFKTSLIDIRGFNNEAYANNEAIQVKSFKMASPDIRIVKTGASTEQKDTTSKGLLSKISRLFADTINIMGAKVTLLDKVKSDSIKADLYALNLRSLDWVPHKGLDVKALILQSPVISNISHEAKEAEQADKNQSLDMLGKHVNIETFVITKPQFSHQQSDLKLLFKTESFNFSGLHLTKQDKSVLALTSVSLVKPYLDIDENYRARVDTTSDKSSNSNLYAMLRPYVNEASIKDINISDANINYNHALDKRVVKHRTINKTNLNIGNLTLNTDLGELDMDDFRFNTTDLRFPIMDGFYTLAFGRIELDKKQGKAQISGMHMIPAYPKMEFSYNHPLHKDWFDVSVGNISLSGVDYPLFFKSNILKASSLDVSKGMLLNLKNKQIYTPPKMQPMIYTKIQELPFGLDIAKANISDFSVVYEELPKGGTETGKILFSNMNGSFSKLTNIASYPEEYMQLDIDGRFMDNGHFTAQWDIPVSADYDCFVLDARLKDFDLRELNQIFLPLAKAEITKGFINDFRFRTEATSMDAHADMLLLYNDLKLSILKDTETEEPNKFLTSMANMIVRSNNPNKPKSKPREANIYIERDPYHSSFNYFWQIIQPAVVESVGVSQGKQNRLKKVAGFFTKVKNFFSGKKDKEEKPQALPE
ncbi:hypothetical protein M2451_002450 [Dysgonomonas sp. PFB1-18]|uniref:hypothetical protein n=1 Tax=unclassified Dysgonomonas TaxID=2630389 RepID=UPI002475020C|nr:MULTISPECIES: hypothetical protein [unclassified Dysgonomonas]MDH6307216.1 hypothetical protein [Dysgonomonas sp. PF1-14]MDH6337135.1 hypothetical protein [Dysgonomonas sp. PF1-16]MDH6381121.1 hypothetical protein [Dysgonomonas sp. PFB1-18]MDH6396300.1 hypothetical protein [Dysgonomonas sp. PF1-23]